MDDLRLILLLFGIVIIAGLYVRERLREKGRDSEQEFDDEVESRPFGGLKISTQTGPEEDYSSYLSALERKREPSIDIENNPNPGKTSDTAGSGPSPSRNHEETDIVTLHVTAYPGQDYTGPALLATFDDLGLVFGEMRIFHHYGIGDLKAERPLFHVANMLEPGYFDPDNMEDFSTRGLALFMQLPAPLNAEVVFDLMLNTARQLTEILGGEVLTQDLRPLSDEHVTSLRTRARNSNQ